MRSWRSTPICADRNDRNDRDVRHSIGGSTGSNRPGDTFIAEPADARLRPWILGAWEFTAGSGAPGTHHVPPDGCALVVLIERHPAPPLLVAQGPQVTPLVVPASPGMRYRGLRLHPAAAPLLVGVPAAALVRDRVPVTALGPVDAAPLVAALRASTVAEAARGIDALFLPLVDRLPIPDPVAVEALARIHRASGREPLGDLARAMEIAPRTMLRRVRAATGLTPKQHARVARFLAAARGLLEDKSLGALAASSGYADQPHFHHEVAALTGLTPAQLARRVRRTEHRLADDHFSQDGGTPAR